jgi:hypothetical protein
MLRPTACEAGHRGAPRGGSFQSQSRHGVAPLGSVMLVGTAGFEPATTRFQTEDSDQAELRPVVTAIGNQGIEPCATPFQAEDATNTPDPVCKPSA